MIGNLICPDDQRGFNLRPITTWDAQGVTCAIGGFVTAMVDCEPRSRFMICRLCWAATIGGADLWQALWDEFEKP